jgi:hypothetical protein
MTKIAKILGQKKAPDNAGAFAALRQTVSVTTAAAATTVAPIVLDFAALSRDVLG